MEVIKTLQDTLNISYNTEQLLILNTEHVGLSIGSTAGSGKTTVLTHLLLKRILTKEIKDTSQVLLTSYSTASVSELNERLSQLFKRFNLSNAVECKTFHSLYYTWIRELGVKRSLVEGGQRLSLLAKVLKDVANITDNDTILTYDTMLGYQINNLLPNSEIVDSELNTIGIDEITYDKIRKHFSSLKEQLSYLDFNDLQLIIYKELCINNNVALINRLRDNYKYIFIDEFQDISLIQYKILKVILDGVDTSNIVIIGDTDQCIYEWRGARPDLFKEVAFEYSLKQLTVESNFRCKSEIVSLAYNSIKNNQSRVEKGMVGVTDGGNVYVKGCQDLYQMSTECLNGILSQATDGKTVCVLVRNIKTATLLYEILLANRIPVHCTNNSVLLSNSVYYKNIVSIQECLSRDTTDLSNLTLLVRSLSSKFISCLETTVSKSQLSLIDVLGDILKGVTTQYDNYRLQIMFNQLKPQTKQDLKTLYEILSSSLDDKDKFIKLLEVYYNGYILTSKHYSYKEQYRLNLGVYQYVLDLINKYGLQYQEQINTKLYQVPETLTQEQYVEISTIHSAKGKEWDTVYYFGADNLTIPNVDFLKETYKGNIYSPSCQKYVEGERRLNFVALTRAKSDLTILATDSLSVFIQECLDKDISNSQTLDNLKSLCV